MHVPPFHILLILPQLNNYLNNKKKEKDSFLSLCYIFIISVKAIINGPTPLASFSTIGSDR